jgi:hypothetical protein
VTRALAGTYAALWAATGVAVLAGALGLHPADVSPPRDVLPATVATAASLLAHNLLVALWPLALVALDWPRLRATRLAGDALIAAQLAAHGLLVGGALAQHPALWRYLPHLPAEWLGLALPAARWLIARRDPDRRALATWALAATAALAAGALLETWAVPL